jgi:hypothetical protein
VSQLANGTVLYDKTYDLAEIPFNRVDDFGVEWHMGKLDGWGTVPPLGSGEQRAGGAGGYVSNERFLPPRHLTLTGRLYADTEADRDAAYFRLVRNIPINTDVTLKVGESTPLQMQVRRDSASIEREAPNRTSLLFQVPLLAVDPRKYGQTLKTDSAQLSTASGLAPPFTPPILLPDSTGGVNTLTMTNDGGFGSPPLFLIQGPVGNPMLTDLATGRYMRWAVSLSSSDILVVDTFALSSYVNLVYYPLDWGSTWIEVQPGTTTLMFSGDVIGAGVPTATYQLRDAWE